MRRFRFIGDPTLYLWDTLPVVGKIYDGDFIWENQGERGEKPLQEWFNDEPEHEDWQEVFDNDGGTILNQSKPLHKDTDLGYYALEILKLRITSRGVEDAFLYFDGDVYDSIMKAKELIKQLDEQGHA